MKAFAEQQEAERRAKAVARGEDPDAPDCHPSLSAKAAAYAKAFDSLWLPGPDVPDLEPLAIVVGTERWFKTYYDPKNWGRYSNPNRERPK